jgi:hypothetical protein
VIIKHVSVIVIAVIVAFSSASAQSTDREKKLKTVAGLIKPLRSGPYMIGKARVELDTIVIPLSASTTELIDENKSIEIMNGFGIGFCKPEISQLMKQYNFVVRFDLSVNGVAKGSKSFSEQQCVAIDKANVLATAEVFAKSNGFGKGELVRFIPGRESLPLFSFREWQGGINLSPEVLQVCERKEVEGAIILCSSKMFDLAGVQSGSIAQVYNGRLSAISILASSDDASTILEAFKAKYGKPCKSSVELWQNRAGAKFDNPVVTWCFRTGDLKFAFFGDKQDYVDIKYTDVNTPKPESPTVNF